MSCFAFITYDNLNRLTWYNFNITGANTLSGVYNYSMDEFGNLLEQVKQSGSSQSPQGHVNLVDRNTNRLNNMTYDLLGNQTQTTSPSGTSSLVYLDQGHVWTFTAGPDTYRYYYDAEGKRRIKAKNASGFAEVSYYFYSGEDLICQKDLGAQIQPDDSYKEKFLLTDHLGSTRAELTFNSSNQPQILKNYDLMPYGEEINPAPVVTEQIKFSGKQRDNESGLDYFGMRYYSNNFCRWISPDKVFNDNHISKPQTWNLYSYVGNNPARFFDDDGNRMNPVTGNRGVAQPSTTKIGAISRSPGNQDRGRFGPTRAGATHSGLDMNAKKGFPMWAAESGKIVTVKNTDTWTKGQSGGEGGRFVEIKLDSGNSVRYCHLDSVDVKQGQTVREGQSVGTAGESGNSKDRGSDYPLHLHMVLFDSKGNTSNSEVWLNDPKAPPPTLTDEERHIGAIDKSTEILDKQKSGDKNPPESHKGRD